MVISSQAAERQAKIHAFAQELAEHWPDDPAALEKANHVAADLNVVEFPGRGLFLKALARITSGVIIVQQEPVQEMAPANDAPKASTKPRKTEPSARAPSPDECVRIFREKMDAEGLSFKGPLKTDIGIVRFHVEGDHKGSLNGWYFCHVSDGWPNGQAGSWRISGGDPIVKWVANGTDGKGPSAAERKAMKERQEAMAAERKAKEEERHAAAAAKAAAIIDATAEAPADHPYLARKQVKSHGLRWTAEWVKEWTDDETGEVHEVGRVANALVVPIRSPESKAPATLQAIFPGKDNALHRDKDFLSGGRKRGCYFIIGKPTEVNGKTVIVICEGYATGASIHEATGLVVVVAFDAGNLRPVAEWFREKSPDAEIIIAGDNDLWTNGNPGASKARDTAKAIDGIVALPVFDSLEDKPTDYNDLHVRGSLVVVRRQILAAVEGKPELAPTDPADPHNLKAAKAIQMLGGDGELTDAQREELVAEQVERAKRPKGPMIAPGDKAPPQRDQLLIVADGADFWRSADGDAYATVEINGHLEHHRVRSAEFRNWLIVEAGRAFPVMMAGRMRPGGFSKNAIEEALTSCEAQAVVAGVVHEAALRVVAHGEAIYIDLGSPEWEVVEVDAKGWRILPSPPVPILRTRRTRQLPRPVSGGSLKVLRELMQFDDPKYDDDWTLIVLWLIAAIRPKGPYPIGALSGEQGSGKTGKARMLRRLVDPCGDDIMQPPGKDDDLIAAAKNNHVLCFDNMSSISPELADSLCRLATGGDIGGRKFYTNDESAAFAAQRPIIINGIPDLATRSDLASRALFIRLDPMKKRMTEEKLWRLFGEAAGGIFGALLDVLCAAMRRLTETDLPGDASLYRMADFALLAHAAEPALGLQDGAALAAYQRNILGAAEVIIKTDAVAVAVTALVEQGGFNGLMSALLNRLNDTVSIDARKAPGWPKSAAVLGGHLRRIAPAMRANGLLIEFPRKGAGSFVKIAINVGSVGNVGDASTLSLLREKKREIGMGAATGAGQTPPPARADNPAPTPTLPTLEPENGGNPRLSACRDSVGDVGSVGVPGAGGDYGLGEVGGRSAPECRQSVGNRVGDVGDDVGVELAAGAELPI